MFVWVRVVYTLTERIVPRPPIGEPQAIVWDTRVFTTDRQLKAFLDAKGISYARWVSRHPAAFALIRHQLRASAIGSTRTTPRRTSKKPNPAAAKTTSAARVPTSATRSSPAVGGDVLTGLFVVLGLALGTSAVLPVAIAPRGLRRLYQVPERRILAVAAAAALLVGAALAAVNP